MEEKVKKGDIGHKSTHAHIYQVPKTQGNWLCTFEILMINFHICLHIFKANSINMALFGFFLQFQPQRRGNLTETENAQNALK